MGLGNYLFADEGAGVHVIQQLAQGSKPPFVDLLEVGNGGFHHLGAMLACGELTLVDAAFQTHGAGAIHALQPRAIADYPARMAAYETGVLDLLKTFHLQNDRPKVILYLIDIEDMQPLGVELSPPVAAAVGEVAGIIRDSWGSLRL